MTQHRSPSRERCDEWTSYSSTVQASALEHNISTVISCKLVFKCHQELCFRARINHTSWRFNLTSIFNKVENLTCFIVVGGELFQHLPIHAEDALLQDAGVGQATLSFLPLHGLQLLLQGLWQVSLHVICCSLENSRSQKCLDSQR